MHERKQSQQPVVRVNWNTSSKGTKNFYENEYECSV